MIWARIYRAALRALPREIRLKHGRAMTALFGRELERAQERGGIEGAVAGMQGTWDALRRGLYERSRRVVRGARGRSNGNELRDGRWSMEGIARDTRHAVRSLLKAPRFTTVVVLTLALGVGANTAIFSVVDAVLLRPLPFPEPERVVNLAWDHGNFVMPALTPVKFEYWRDHARSLEGMATWRSSLGRVDVGGWTTGIRTLRVSRDFLGVLGYEPVLGRDFTAEEYVPDAPRIALLSHGLWQDHFAGAPNVVGNTIRLDEEPYTIVGVLPESFAFPYEEEATGRSVGIVLPLGLRVDPTDEGANWPAIARLAGGFGLAEAEADLTSLDGPFRTAYPQQVYEGDRGMTLVTFGDIYVGDTAHVLWILMGAVVLVLLIACANVANLFLARAARRRGEIALRAALGATRGQIGRLVLTESLLVALAAGALGLPLAGWAVRILVALAPSQVPRLADVGIDWRVMLFTLAAALATGLSFGGFAAWPAVRTRLSGVLKESGRTSSGPGRGRQGLLVAQAALSMVLLFGAGLLLSTLISLRRVDPGFDPSGLLAVRFPVKPAGYGTSGDLWELERRVVDGLDGSPEVHSIAGATNLPLERGVNFPVSIGGRPDDFEGAVEWRAVTPDYFRTLGIELLEGRAFTRTDLEGSPPVAVVNQAFVRRYFPEGSPIGQHLEIGRYRGEYIDATLVGPGAEIVGVVSDIREVSLRADPRRTMYVPQAQAPDLISDLLGTMPVFIARSRFTVTAVGRTVIDLLRDVDPGLPEPEVFPLDDVVAGSLARERFGATLLSIFASLALALTAFGIYGVLAHSVRQRRREIGVRMALGAGANEVTRMVLAQGIAPVALGLVVGVAGSLGLSRVVAGYVWGVSPADPVTLTTVAAILLAVALVSSWLPAREAVGMNPATTLSAE